MNHRQRGSSSAERKGPGAVSSPSRACSSDDDAKRYTPQNVLNGWVPAEFKR